MLNLAFEGATVDGAAGGADARDAAKAGGFFNGFYQYVALHAAVLDGATVVAHDAAGIFVADNVGIGEDDVLHGTAVPDVTKEALAPVVVALATFVDAYAADGVVLAVVGALERHTVDAHGGEVVLAAGVPLRGVAVGDVGGLLESETLAVVAVVARFDV